MSLRDLGGRDLTWWSLRTFVDQLPEGRESAFRRAVDPKGDGLWTLDTHLAALLVDGVRILAWQQTEDGVKGRNRPTPIDRPGVREAREEKAARIKYTAEEWMARRAARKAALAQRREPAASA